MEKRLDGLPAVHRRGAQASLPTKTAPPVKRRFRIEPRTPASPAQRRAARSERAVEARRGASVMDTALPEAEAAADSPQFV
jgi:hypothetical protein